MNSDLHYTICSITNCTSSDHVHRKVDLSGSESQYLVKTASITVHHVPSVEPGGERSVGAVTFGEAFIESVLRVEKRGESPHESQGMISVSNSLCLDQYET